MRTIAIFINSSHRADKKIITTEQMPDRWRKFACIVVPHDQVQNYRTANTFPILAIPKDVPQCLPSQRQWVMENAKDDFIFFMDDDLVFHTRTLNGKLKRSTPSRMESMLREVTFHLTMQNIPIVGISCRMGNNRVPEDHTDITRVTRCYAVNKEVFNKVGAVFDPIDTFVMEDFHMNLCFLEKGHKNRVLYKYAQSDSGSNAEGGCSLYRTQEIQKRSALFLKQKHPMFVTVKEKKTKGSWIGFKKDKDGFITRTDVIVHWKKAYRFGIRKPKRGISKFL